MKEINICRLWNLLWVSAPVQQRIGLVFILRWCQISECTTAHSPCSGPNRDSGSQTPTHSMHWQSFCIYLLNLSIASSCTVVEQLYRVLFFFLSCSHHIFKIYLLSDAGWFLLRLFMMFVRCFNWISCKTIIDRTSFISCGDQISQF